MFVIALMLFISKCYGTDVALQTHPVPSGSHDREEFLSDHNVFPIADNFIRFWLNGTGKAYVYLESADRNDTERKIFYKIAISGWNNKSSSISLFNDTDGFLVAEATGNQIMSNYKYDFWISWCGNNIKVGRGSTYGIALQMSWWNPFPFDIAEIGIASQMSCNWYFYSRNHYNSKQKVCPPQPCNSFSRTEECLKYINLKSMAVPKRDCIWACSDDKHCYGWTYDDQTNIGNCTLLSGYVEQTFDKMTCFIKHGKE